MNAKQLPPLNKLERFSTNPYLVEQDGETYVHTKRDIGSHIQKVDNSSEAYFWDDIIYETHIGRTFDVNQNAFDEVYFNALKDVLNLSKGAQRVLMHMVKSADSNGIAVFDYKHQYKEVGYKSLKGGLFALRELIAEDIVRPHIDANTWWVNPMLIWDEDEESLILYKKFVIRKDWPAEE